MDAGGHADRVPDPPLLNADGVHKPWALRSIVRATVPEDGTVGLGETYGDAPASGTARGRRARAVAGLEASTGWTAVRGRSGLFDHRAQDVPFDRGPGALGLRGRLPRRPGKLAGRPVSDLLGGKVRDAVRYSAYLFYKWAGHPGPRPGRAGARPSTRRASSRRPADSTAVRLHAPSSSRAGSSRPTRRSPRSRALAEAFPGHPLRLDPNGAWTVQTSLKVAEELGGVLEYLEDPTAGIAGMAEVAARHRCPAGHQHVRDRPSTRSARPFAQDAVQVVLSDHHYWGGLRDTRELAAHLPRRSASALSMHSNTHLGIVLAAMTHVAAATPNLDYACDTHYPGSRPASDVIVDGAIGFVRTERSRCRPRRASASSWTTRTASPACTSSTSPAGCRTATTPATCGAVNPEFTSGLPRW